MPAAEPGATAVVTTAVGVLLGLSAALTFPARRARVPISLLYLGLGMLAGAEGVGAVVAIDPRLLVRIGTVSLALILFDGGLRTPARDLRRVLAPSIVLATGGVVLTAGALALAGHLLGVPTPSALLVGAAVSSTDAAAVFAALRGSGLALRRRLSLTVELESSLNDPTAVLLTLAATHFLLGERPSAAALVGFAVRQLGVGLVGGLFVGAAGRALLRRAGPIHGLIPVLTTAIALTAFGLPTLLGGSGFLAVFVAGLAVGAGHVPYRAGVLRVHDAIAWFGQVGMFLLIGLVIAPGRLARAAPDGIALGLLLALVARPLATLLCLLPARYPPREALLVGAAGLRGAVPVVLASFPLLAGVPGAQRAIDVVLVVSLVSAFVPGATLPWITRRLGGLAKGPPEEPPALEIAVGHPLDGDLLSFTVHAASAVAGAAIGDLSLPEHATVVLVLRGGTLLGARSETVLRPGDHVTVSCRPDERDLVLLLFGQTGEE